MSTPQQPPAGAPGQPTTPIATGADAPGADRRPTAPFPPPAPQSGHVASASRAGRLLPVLALVFSIVGFVVVCLGFLAFVPGAGRALGFASFAGWGFLIAALVLAIVALVRRAAAKGMSVAALIVSIVGGAVGIAAAVVVMVASLFAYTSEVVGEFGDLVPDLPGTWSVPDDWSLPEGSSDPDVQADCDALLAADPGTDTAPSGLGDLFDGLAEGMKTDQVREPLEDLADAYEDLMDIEDPTDMAEASAELQRAATALGDACGIDIDDLP